MKANYKNLILAVVAVAIILPSIFIIHNYIYYISPLEKKEFESKDDLTIRESFKKKYDVEYADLVTRKVYAFSIPSSEIIPERNCHKFTTEELYSLSQDLKYVMEESTRSLFSGDIQNGFYSGFSNPVSFVDAKKLIERYDFTVTQKTVYDTLNKINDTAYHFECIFEDDKYQYKLGFDFDSHYAKGERLVFVNVTKNDQGIPIIENPHVNLFSGGFNGTIIFNNKLEKPITIQITNPPADGDWTEHFVNDKMTIPAGKVWDVSPRNWHTPGDLAYQYIITPENLQGTFTLKPYPPCMTENEVRSLYSQVEVYPKFPLYIPEGYSFECGIHHTNWAVNLVYLDDDGRKKMTEKYQPVSHFAKSDLVDSNALILLYWNGYVANNWEKDPTYDKYESQKNSSGFKGSRLITTAREPAVLFTEYYPDRRSANTLSIFTDNAIRYTVTGNFMYTELIKIGESFFNSDENEN
jgi:hypothetical protein